MLQAQLTDLNPLYFSREIMFNSSFFAAACSRSGFDPSGGVEPVISGPIAE